MHEHITLTFCVHSFCTSIINSIKELCTKHEKNLNCEIKAKNVTKSTFTALFHFDILKYVILIFFLPFILLVKFPYERDKSMDNGASVFIHTNNVTLLVGFRIG